MNIRSAGKGRNHILVPGKMGKNPKLNLGIVCVDKGFSLPGNKKSSHPAAKLCPYGNILEVRLKGAYASGSGFLLVKAGVDPAVRSKSGKKPVNIG